LSSWLLDYMRPFFAVLAGILLATSISYFALIKLASKSSISHQTVSPPPIAAATVEPDGSVTLITVRRLPPPLPPGPREEKTLIVKIDLRGPRLSSCSYIIVPAEVAAELLPPAPGNAEILQPEELRSLIQRLHAASLAQAECGREARIPAQRGLVAVVVFTLPPGTTTRIRVVNGTVEPCSDCVLSDSAGALVELAAGDAGSAMEALMALLHAVEPPLTLTETYTVVTRPAGGSSASAAAVGAAGLLAAVVAAGLLPRRRGP